MLCLQAQQPVLAVNDLAAASGELSPVDYASDKEDSSDAELAEEINQMEVEQELQHELQLEKANLTDDSHHLYNEALDAMEVDEVDVSAVDSVVSAADQQVATTTSHLLGLATLPLFAHAEAVAETSNVAMVLIA